MASLHLHKAARQQGRALLEKGRAKPSQQRLQRCWGACSAVRRTSVSGTAQVIVKCESAIGR